MIEVQTRPLGGSALTRDALAGALSEWYAPALANGVPMADGARRVTDDFAGRDWLGPLEPALHSTGVAKQRLRDCAAAGGIVITAGQQPGLFGGPLYVLHKALTALALADEVQEQTGIRTAPIFWAATDDTDYAEANHVATVLRGELQTLGGHPSATPGRAMAATPIGAVEGDIERLAEACGSAADATPIAAVARSYAAGATVGGAYVRLLRELLEPLGIAVLDAAHPAIREAAKPMLTRALERGDAVRDALQQRSVELRTRKHRPQVADVPALSLVFATGADGLRQRVPVRDAATAANDVDGGRLGPNVLLRPIVERSILPTLAYVGGPGEVAYFAQVSAVAEALGVAVPRIVPRWSGTLIEPHVREILTRLDASLGDFRDPHAIEGRIARAEIAPGVRHALDEIAGVLARESEVLKGNAATSQPLQRSVESMRRGVEHRMARLERRYAAAVKQSGTQRLHDVAAARASLFPSGQPQERVLSFIPFLSRYGAATTDVILASARAHVSRLLASG
ncbi:MAG: bacillithiol biosynthesis protein BshC [Gemmatimonadaceae bacterium]